MRLFENTLKHGETKWKIICDEWLDNFTTSFFLNYFLVCRCFLGFFSSWTSIILAMWTINSTWKLQLIKKRVLKTNAFTILLCVIYKCLEHRLRVCVSFYEYNIFFRRVNLPKIFYDIAHKYKQVICTWFAFAFYHPCIH